MGKWPFKSCKNFATQRGGKKEICWGISKQYKGTGRERNCVFTVAVKKMVKLKSGDAGVGWNKGTIKHENWKGELMNGGRARSSGVS